MPLSTRLGFLGLSVAAATSIAIACGPHFPWQLLSDRAETLKAAPANSFGFEAARLVVAPPDRLRAKEIPLNGFGEPNVAAYEAERTEAEKADVPDEASATLTGMRAEVSGDEAYDAGAATPAGVRLYTAGAVAFQNSDFQGSVEKFKAVLSLPEETARLRSVWAAFMLGRANARLEQIEEAADAFAIARRRALAGDPDPIGLAVASLGEEGRLHFKRAKLIIGATFPEDDAVATEQYARDMARAAALYAEPAARGSAGAIQSLRIVANHLTDDPARVKATVADPLIQRLLAVYVLARVPQEHDQAVNSGSDKPSIALVLARAISERKLESPYGGDRLAALAYRTGHYELAQQLADMARGPLAAWVKAKIAIQKNELVPAATYYSEAARSFPGYDQIIDSMKPDRDIEAPSSSVPAQLVIGETAVLSLARGQYVEALDLLLPHADTYWGDVVHIAERVLTTDELKEFTDRNIRSASYAGTELGGRSSRHAALLDLLGRRLVRERRFAEAAAYFQAEETKVTAFHYGQLLARAENKRSDLAKARLLYMAAIIARRSGMQIMGYEGSPDYTVWQGGYEGGAGQSNLAAAWVTTDERSRFEGSKAAPNLRFHYRYIAIGHAEQAAGKLPARSQAFAAILCEAASWVIDRPDGLGKAQEVYRRYVREGAYVAFAATFGRQCPDPSTSSSAIGRFPRAVSFSHRGAGRGQGRADWRQCCEAALRQG